MSEEKQIKASETPVDESGNKIGFSNDNKFYVETIDTTTQFIDHDYTKVGFDPKSKHIIFLKSNNGLTSAISL